MTAQGSPRVIFKRAIQHGNVLIAETTAREFALTLKEALQLVLLYAAYEPAKLERAALRWFRRWLDESEDVSFLQAQIALAALARLRSDERDAAAGLLSRLAKE